jgi:hypothetical protein
MDTLKQHLAMSPQAKEAFERDERARLRASERMQAYGADAEHKVAAAEDKRARRRARNLVHCS